MGITHQSTFQSLDLHFSSSNINIKRIHTNGTPFNKVRTIQDYEMGKRMHRKRL